MEDVLVQGLGPDQRSLLAGKHRVGLVYGSAVPVDSYLNKEGILVASASTPGSLLAFQRKSMKWHVHVS